MTEPLDAGPEPIPMTVYRNDDSDVEWFPFGQTVADIPDDFADYDYILDVWQGEDFATLLLTSNTDVVGFQITTTRDDATGMIRFRFPRSVMLAFTIVEDMRYDVREIDPDGKALTIFAGVFNVTTRGTITGT